MTILKSFDSEKFYLGSLCKHKHDWNETGQSLRYIRCNECKACRLEKYKHRHDSILKNKQAYYQRNRDVIIQRRRENYKQNREVLLKRQHEYDRKNRALRLARDRKRYQLHREILLEKKRNYYWQNVHILNEKSRQYRRSEKGKLAFQKANHKYRARKKLNHHFNYTAQQIKELYQKFNGECAYCGATKQLSVDHFIAISAGGPDCLGNLVPSCKTCNSSKQDSDPKLWFLRQKFYSKKRWKNILKILGKTESSYNQLPLL